MSRNMQIHSISRLFCLLQTKLGHFFALENEQKSKRTLFFPSEWKILSTSLFLFWPLAVNNSRQFLYWKRVGESLTAFATGQKLMKTSSISHPTPEEFLSCLLLTPSDWTAVRNFCLDSSGTIESLFAKTEAKIYWPEMDQNCEIRTSWKDVDCVALTWKCRVVGYYNCAVFLLF